MRLRQGRAEDAVVYSADPVAVARRWESEGAKYLHVVDLDGAFQGRPVHGDLIRRIAGAIGIPFEVGGGLRTDGDLQATLSAGASRVVVGTRAFVSPGDLARLARRFGERLAVGIDAREGWVQVQGWTETTRMRAVELAGQVGEAGVRWLIYTDTARDGMLGGVNAAAMDGICAATLCRVIASGGVTGCEDIRALKALGRENLAGAIVGKALYDGKVRLADLLAT